MVTIFWLSAILALESCKPSPSPQHAAAAPSATPASAVDDGTFLQRIDPLGGQWQVVTIDGEDFQRFKPWVNFSAGGFLNHGAGCSGGYPAFYRLDGQRIAIVRREEIHVGKCAAATPATRAAAAASERRLTTFLDQAAAWDRPDDRTLTLTSKDGTRAVLSRPVEPHPDLGGRWIIEAIGGEPLVTERRPPTLFISMGVDRRCCRLQQYGRPLHDPCAGADRRNPADHGHGHWLRGGGQCRRRADDQGDDVRDRLSS
jgi:hypothetical protein